MRGGGNDFIYGDWQAYLPYEHLAITDYDYQWIAIDDEGNVTTFVDSPCRASGMTTFMREVGMTMPGEAAATTSSLGRG